MPPLNRWMFAALTAVSALLPAQAATVLPPAALSAWACTGVCGSLGADGHVTLSPLGNAQYGYVATAGSEAFGVSPLQLDANSRGNGTETNGSRYLSGSFSAASGSTLEMRFNYVSTDGKGYDDYAWARVVDATDGHLVAWLFTARSSNSSTGKIVPGDVVRRSEFDPDERLVDYGSFRFNTQVIDDPVNWSPLGYSNQSCWRDNAQGCGFTGWLQSRYSFASTGSFRVEVGVVNWGDGAYDSGLAFDFTGLQPAMPSAVPEPGQAPLLAAGLLASAWWMTRQRRRR